LLFILVYRITVNKDVCVESMVEWTSCTLWECQRERERLIDGALYLQRGTSAKVRGNCQLSSGHQPG